jgi:nucleoside permease NupC
MRTSGAALEARCFPIAAFCRLANLLNHLKQMGWLVGAVGIELKAVLNTSKLIDSTKLQKREKTARTPN